jgi:hypothetical protein
VKGLAQEDGIADAVNLSKTRVNEVLTALQKEGLVQRRNGRISGWSLTPAGKEHQARAVGGLTSPDTVTSCYRRFVALNQDFKVLCTDWQLRKVGGVLSPNDHTDPTHDRDVVDRLTLTHARVRAIVVELEEEVHPRYASYVRRFDAALKRLQGGDQSALAKPLTDSYHDVWMELHQDFLLVLHKQRGAADGH